MRLTSLLRGVAPFVASGLVLLATAGSAAAHARLERSEPISGAALGASPSQVLLDFDESVGLGLGGVTLSTADSTPVEIGAATHPSGRPDVVTAALPALNEGVYVVSFRVVSADGHPVSGNIVFRIGSGDGTTVAGSNHRVSRSVGLSYGVVRALAYLSLTVGLGLTCVVATIWRGGWLRLRRAIAIAGWTLAASTWAQFLLAGPYLAGTGFGDAFEPRRWQQVSETAAGKWWMARFAALTALGALAVAVRFAQRQRLRWPIPFLATTGGVVVVASFVGDGHAVAGRYLAVGVVATAVHLVAMATWLGGLAVLAWGQLSDDPDLVAGVLKRWSVVAATAVALLALTGTAQTWRLLDGWSAFDSAFGQLLIAKTVAVVVMVVLGNIGRRRLVRVRRSPSTDSLPRSLRGGVIAELFVGVGVLFLTTVLVQSEPRRSASAAPVSIASPSSTTASRPEWHTEIVQGPWTMKVTLDQAAVGRRRLQISLDEGSTPFHDPLQIRARLRFDAESLGPVPVALQATGPRTWSTDAVELTRPGTWSLEVLLDDPATSARFAASIPIE